VVCEEVFLVLEENQNSPLIGWQAAGVAVTVIVVVMMCSLQQLKRKYLRMEIRALVEEVDVGQVS